MRESNLEASKGPGLTHPPRSPVHKHLKLYAVVGVLVVSRSITTRPAWMRAAETDVLNEMRRMHEHNKSAKRARVYRSPELTLLAVYLPSGLPPTVISRKHC